MGFNAGLIPGRRQEEPMALVPVRNANRVMITADLLDD